MSEGTCSSCGCDNTKRTLAIHEDLGHEYDDLPVSTRHHIDMYARERQPTGQFLKAVLSNDLFGAFREADHRNTVGMRAIVKYIYNHCAIACWGTEQQYVDWINPCSSGSTVREDMVGSVDSDPE